MTQYAGDLRSPIKAIEFGEAGVLDTRGFRVAGWETDLRAEPIASSAERRLRVGER